MVFDSTVRRELSRSFGATLVVILTIVFTMLLIRTVGQAAKGQVAPADVVLLLGYVALGNLPTMLALSLFVAIVVTLGRMYRDTEMAVWFASGIGLTRFVRPVLHTAWPVLLVIGLLTLFVWPWGNRNSDELRQRYAERSDLSRVTPGIFQSSSDGTRVFFIERESIDGVNARNVFVLTNNGDVESVTSASRGRIESEDETQMLVLESGQRNDINLSTGDKVQARFDDYRIAVGERAARIAGERPPKTLPTRTLLADPTLRHQGELSWRLGLALGAANLVLLGVGLSATPARRASNWNLLFALLSFIVYYNLISLSQAWIGTGRIALGPALLLLHGGTFACALALLTWRENATVWRLWPRRTAAG
jgi:lipopolysaccharide export system permease protein